MSVTTSKLPIDLRSGAGRVDLAETSLEDVYARIPAYHASLIPPHFHHFAGTLQESSLFRCRSLDCLVLESIALDCSSF